MADAKLIIDAATDRVAAFKFASTVLEAMDMGMLMDMAERADTFVFVDRKFADVPKQNVGAAEEITRKHSAVTMLSMHACAGSEAMRDMVSAMKKRNPADPPLSLAITLLTSISEEDCQAMYGGATAQEMVLRFADLAIKAGMPGLVCSGKEVAAVKHRWNDVVTVVPGTRSEGADHGTQARVVTPEQAIRSGADYLVIGGQVTSKKGYGREAMRAELDRIIKEIEAGLK